MDADKRILDALTTGLKSGTLGHHAQLSVDVQDGIVTIAGRVNTPAERRAVERAAKRVAGIRTLILKIGAAAMPLSATGPHQRLPKESARKEFG
jgi:osmotically-inducible protein OsmY